MWSDELENKIRETTEGSQPAYEERAWAKMEALLDKHLPQKRRRFIPLILLPLALVGTGIFFAIQQQSKRNITTEITTEKINSNQPVTSGGEVQNRKEEQAATIALSPEDLARQSNRPVSEVTDTRTNNELNVSVSKTQAGSVQKISTRKKAFSQVPDQPAELAPISQEKQKPGYEQKEIVQEKTRATEKTISGADKPVVESPASNDKKDGEQAQIADPTGKQAPKTKHSRGSNFAFTVSAGPDFSSVDFNEPGEWRMAYGVGVMYSLSKKISLRTGFFAGRKVYTADPYDYKSNYSPPPTLQKIEANCLVYEIPLDVLYSFPKMKKHNWFVSGGLSSYLMKEETYDYVHKYPSGQVHYTTIEYKNENAHFFSVANLSGGYQYHFSDRFSLMAEPYVKIPLTGVGQGKVQLNSGGILFTGVFKPFHK
jgi:hypothetical protein